MSGIGDEIRARRLRIGMSVRQLAKEAKVDRDRVGALEAGEGNPRDTTVSKVVATLDRLEEEMGMDEPREPQRSIKLTVRGNFGVEAIIEGDDVDAIDALFAKVVARMSGQSDPEHPITTSVEQVLREDHERKTRGSGGAADGRPAAAVTD